MSPAELRDRLTDAISNATGVAAQVGYGLAQLDLQGQSTVLRRTLAHMVESIDEAVTLLNELETDRAPATVTELHPKDPTP